jgi:hypothetical protein
LDETKRNILKLVGESKRNLFISNELNDDELESGIINLFLYVGEKLWHYVNMFIE